LFASARFAGTGARPEITLPDGTVDPDDATLSRWLGRRVELRVVDDSKAPRTYENPMDVDAEADWVTFDGPSGPFHDSVRTRVSLVSTTTLGEWDRRRFRANVVLGGDGEDALVGTEVALGDARLDVRKRIGRCVIVTRPQPGSIERDLDVLRTVNRDRDGCVGIGALVARPGIVHVGDALTRLP
jgi:uncharacterized protein YcbX